MARCLQATSNNKQATMSVRQCWPSSMMPYGVTTLQCIKSLNKIILVHHIKHKNWSNVKNTMCLSKISALISIFNVRNQYNKSNLTSHIFITALYSLTQLFLMLLNMIKCKNLALDYEIQWPSGPLHDNLTWYHKHDTMEAKHESSFSIAQVM